MLNPDFVRPRYGSHCFSDIPQTVKYLLTGEGEPLLAPEVLGRYNRQYDTVILFFIDAFGWHQFEKYCDDYPFLQRMAKLGKISKLTSQFPSTTAAHTTSIHTGLPVGQSGVYAWQYYEPQIDALIAPLLFSFAGTSQRNMLKSAGISPEDILPEPTIYLDWQQHGVNSYIIQHRLYTPSPYSDHVFRGAEAIPYGTLPEAMTNLELLLMERKPPSYFFFYFDKIDIMAHKYGPNSLYVDAEIDLFLTAMERMFERRWRDRWSNTLFMMVADHGQAETDPATTIYLNVDPKFSGIHQYIKRASKRASNRGRLVPAGSCRDMFLHIEDGLVDEAHAFLEERLVGRADVHKVQDLIDQKLFGLDPVSDVFKSRVGDVVILPYAGESVWWYKKRRFEQRGYGNHGGMTPEEMEIPLFLYDFDE